MPNIPGWAWPEPPCYLNGSVLHVGQARWKQRDTFLPLVEPAKWMVVVYVNDVLVHGEAPATPFVNDATAYDGEMPLSQKTFSLDLDSYGVHQSHPLDPKVTVDQYAATKVTATHWYWERTDWERHQCFLRTYIDSNAGIPKAMTWPFEPAAAAGDSWLSLHNGFYDEGARSPEDFEWFPEENPPPLGAPEGTVGMQFDVIIPDCIIYGAQVWTPPEVFDLPLFEPFDIIVRLWEGNYGTGAANDVKRIVSEPAVPGWLNLIFDEPYVAKPQFIRGEPTTFDPYPYVMNPDHNGFYVIGYQTSGGGFVEGPPQTIYERFYPEHRKVYMVDNYPALSGLINILRPIAEKGPEWVPNGGVTQPIFCGPIIEYTPIYPVPRRFLPQIYRRVVQPA